MRVIIDGFGGDNAPLEVLKGSVQAVKELGVDVTVVGDVEKMKLCANENGIDISALSLYQADGVMEVCEDPKTILKEHSDSSMAVGLKLLQQGEGDAFVSAGSTGALVMGSTFIVKRLRGIKRCALATVLPTAKDPVLLMDCGANAECRPEMLMQFAVMGSTYMNKIIGVDNPRVGLANIGAEPTKGRESDVEAYGVLSNAPINFIGNVEGRDIPLGEADVVVTDGFTGNLILKTIEGMGKFFSVTLKSMFKSGILSAIGYLCLKKQVNGFRKKMDYTEYGGVPLLGIAKPVIKAHGSSNAKAFYNAIRQAKLYTENEVIKEFSEALEKVKASSEE